MDERRLMAEIYVGIDAIMLKHFEEAIEKELRKRTDKDSQDYKEPVG